MQTFAVLRCALVCAAAAALAAMAAAAAGGAEECALIAQSLLNVSPIFAEGRHKQVHYASFRAPLDALTRDVAVGRARVEGGYVVRAQSLCCVCLCARTRHAHRVLQAAHRNDANLSAAILDYFVTERTLLRRLRGPCVPLLIAACHEGARDWQQVATVVEALRPVGSVAVDASVPLSTRLLLAANAVVLAKFFDNFRTSDASVATEPVIYGDFNARQFGVRRNGELVLVDLQTFHAYTPLAPFNSHTACTKTSECRATTIAAHDHVMQSLSVRPPHDFDCDERRGRCAGLDARTNLYALCELLVRHLLVGSSAVLRQAQAVNASADIVQPALDALAACRRSEPSARLSAPALRLRFLQLAAQACATPAHACSAATRRAVHTALAGAAGGARTPFGSRAFALAAAALWQNATPIYAVTPPVATAAELSVIPLHTSAASLAEYQANARTLRLLRKDKLL